jgi:hypothetical protein
MIPPQPKNPKIAILEPCSSRAKLPNDMNRKRHLRVDKIKEVQQGVAGAEAA